MSSEIPNHVGSYTVVARLDRHGDDAVYEVRDAGGRKLALKLYGQGESDDLRAFRRETLQRVAALRHPAVVRYEEVGEHEGRLFAVMELFPSTTMRTVLKGGAVPLRSSLRILRQLAEGLACLHDNGIVHGCLNPSRILVSPEGDTAKMIEPGMCTERRSQDAGATAAMGAAMFARYLAPELLRASGNPDPRADIYSLGVLFYQALTGKVPEANVRLPSQESDAVPPQLDEVVLRCLRQEPAARFGSARELGKTIDRVVATLPGGFADQLETFTSSARGYLGGGGATGRRWRWALAAVLAAIGVVAALLLARAYL
jgi:serine/threonine-protein kinase